MPPEDPSTSVTPAADPDLRDQLDALLDTPDADTALSDSHISDSTAQSAPLAHSDTRGENPAPESGIDITLPPASADHSAGALANRDAVPPHSGGDSSIALSTPDNVEDLDAQLAMLTEGLLSNDGGTPAAPSIPVAPSTSAAPVAREADSLSPTATLGATAASAPAALTQSTPAAAQTPPATPATLAAAHASKSAPAQAKATPVKQAAAKVKEVATPVAAKAASTIAPIGTRLLVAINKPIEGKSATVRDSLGWVGLWTLFNATCIWVFVAFFQKPPELGIPHDAPHISSDDADNAGQHSPKDKDHAGSASDASKDAHADTHDDAASEHSKPSAKPAAKPVSDHGGH